MSTVVVAALIAACAAVAGGLLTAHGSRSVEALRARAAITERADERKLATLERFLLASNAWLDWLIYIEDQGYHDKLDELNLRVKARDDAYRQLLLLASDSLFHWMRTVYNPLEYEVKRTYSREVRHGRRVSEAGKQARLEFSRLLRDDLIDRFRPEVASLREPFGRGRGGSG